MQTYSVDSYTDAGHVAMRRETTDRNEALSWARETPHASVCVTDEFGWVLQTAIFSPKHPVTDGSIK